MSTTRRGATMPSFNQLTSSVPPAIRAVSWSAAAVIASASVVAGKGGLHDQIPRAAAALIAALICG